MENTYSLSDALGVPTCSIFVTLYLWADLYGDLGSLYVHYSGPVALFMWKSGFQVLRITAIGVEVRTPKGALHWCLDFRDMDTPAIILLSDAYGRKGQEGGGFVLCPMFGRKCKAFTAASGASNSSILTNLVSSSHITCNHH